MGGEPSMVGVSSVGGGLSVGGGGHAPAPPLGVSPASPPMSAFAAVSALSFDSGSEAVASGRVANEAVVASGRVASEAGTPSTLDVGSGGGTHHGGTRHGGTEEQQQPSLSKQMHVDDAMSGFPAPSAFAALAHVPMATSPPD